MDNTKIPPDQVSQLIMQQLGEALRSNPKFVQLAQTQEQVLIRYAELGGQLRNLRTEEKRMIQRQESLLDDIEDISKQMIEIDKAERSKLGIASQDPSVATLPKANGRKK